MSALILDVRGVAVPQFEAVEDMAMDEEAEDAEKSDDVLRCFSGP